MEIKDNKDMLNMKCYYTEEVTEPLARKLKIAGYPIQECDFLSGRNKFQVLETHRDLRFNITREVYENYEIPQYSEVFDWLMEKGWLVSIGREYDFAAEQVTERFEWAIEKVGCFSSQPDEGGGWCNTWHEAAEMAIEKALTLI